MGWQIIIAPSAQADLAEIVRYIARHNSDAAARLGFELITRAESLTDFPELGRSVPEFHQPDLREIISRTNPEALEAHQPASTEARAVAA